MPDNNQSLCAAELRQNVSAFHAVFENIIAGRLQMLLHRIILDFQVKNLLTQKGQHLIRRTQKTWVVLVRQIIPKQAAHAKPRRPARVRRFEIRLNLTRVTPKVPERSFI